MQDKEFNYSQLATRIIFIQAMLETSINLQAQIISDQNGSDLRKLRDDIWKDVETRSQEIHKNLPNAE